MRIRFTLCLPASAREVFHLLHEASAQCGSGNWLGFGAQGASFRRPYVASIRMTQGPWAFSRLGGMWRLVPDGTDACRLHVTYNLRTTPRASRWLLEPVMSAVFYLQTRRRMQRLRALLCR